MSISISGLTPLLEVFDMATSLRFYRDILGFEVVSTSGEGDNIDWVLLKLGGAALMLNTRFEASARPDAPDPARVTAHEDTELFFACPDADEVYEQLRSTGVEVSPPAIAPYGMKQVTIADPDGFRLWFQCPVS